jgi:hypothetical protein
MDEMSNLFIYLFLILCQFLYVRVYIMQIELPFWVLLGAFGLPKRIRG